MVRILTPEEEIVARIEFIEENVKRLLEEISKLKTSLDDSYTYSK